MPHPILNIPEDFLIWLKESTPPGIWSRGVALSRATTALFVAEPVKDELHFKIADSTARGPLGYEVTLWVRDHDAHCTCPTQQEYCAHRVAIALMVSRGQIDMNTEPDATTDHAPTQLHYQWEKDTDGRITSLTRTLGGESLNRYGNSLVSLLGGIESGRIARARPVISKSDLDVDRILNEQPMDWPKLLKAMGALGTKFSIEKPSIQISWIAHNQTLRVTPTLSDPHPAGTWMGHNQVITYRYPPLSQVIEKTGADAVADFIANTIPTLMERFEVHGAGAIPEVIQGNPTLTWIWGQTSTNLKPSEQTRVSEQTHVTVRMEYPAAGAGQIIRRNRTAEQNLQLQLKNDHQLVIDQPTELSPSRLFALKRALGVQNTQHNNEYSILESLPGANEIPQDLWDRYHHYWDAIVRAPKSKQARIGRSILKGFAKNLTVQNCEESFSIHCENFLRPYQKEGAHFMARLRQEGGSGAILADEMGLGKTLQSLAVLQAPALIVVPTSLLSNWQSELKRFRPDLSVLRFHGSNRGPWQDPAENSNQVILTTYALVRTESAVLNYDFKTVIYDEAHCLRNEETLSYQACASIPANFKIAITGTPIQNRLNDLWSLSRIVEPDLFSSEADWQALTGNERVLMGAVRSVMIRRKKEEVLKDLPEKTRITHPIELTRDERELYETVFIAGKKLTEENPNRPAMQIFETLLRARQAAVSAALFMKGTPIPTSSKLLRLFEILQELNDNGHSVLVYSQWTGVLDLIESEWASRMNDAPHVRLDGSTRDREAVITKFQESTKPVVFLLSLHAGGVGLNLTRADHVIFLDPWWNPQVELQAEDRVHRIGQHRPVFIHRLIAEDTVEEGILKLQESKRGLADQLKGAELSLSEVTALTVTALTKMPGS